ncbi:MAG: hypothetical protein O6840_05445, partial [Nitrospirae bacterium]|nr:hypothetical protein [Nitrospirota bacterium]
TEVSQNLRDELEESLVLKRTGEKIEKDHRQYRQQGQPGYLLIGMAHVLFGHVAQRIEGRTVGPHPLRKGRPASPNSEGLRRDQVLRL